MNKIWSGQEKLWKAFWGGLGLFAAVYILVGVAGGALHKTNEMHAFLDGVFDRSVNLIYMMAWSVAVWKCRKNSGNSIWKYLALLMVTIFVVAHIGSLLNAINPPALTSYNPSCIKTLEDFAKQNGIDQKQYIDSNKSFLQKCTKELNTKSCTQTMEDFAKKNGLDPEAYVKQNQSYISQCTQNLEKN